MADVPTCTRSHTCRRTHGVSGLTTILLLLVALHINVKYPGAALLLIVLAFCG